MPSRDFDDVTRQRDVDDDDDVYDDWSDCQSNNGCCCCSRDKHSSSRSDCVLDLDIHGISRITRSSPAGSSPPPLRRSVYSL